MIGMATSRRGLHGYQVRFSAVLLLSLLLASFSSSTLEEVRRGRLQELRGRLGEAPGDLGPDLRGVILQELRRFQVVDVPLIEANLRMMPDLWSIGYQWRSRLLAISSLLLSLDALHISDGPWSYQHLHGAFTAAESEVLSVDWHGPPPSTFPPVGFRTGMERDLPWLMRELLPRIGFRPPWVPRVLISQVLDWAHAQRVSLAPLTWQQALVRAEAWHAALALVTPGIAVATGQGELRLLHRWDDGWTLVQLLDVKALRYEGGVLGHCIGSSPVYAARIDRLDRYRYTSLRDPGGESRVTVEWVNRGTPFRREWFQLQVRGLRNRQPLGADQDETVRALRLLQPDIMRWNRDEALVLLTDEDLWRFSMEEPVAGPGALGPASTVGEAIVERWRLLSEAPALIDWPDLDFMSGMEESTEWMFAVRFYGEAHPYDDSFLLVSPAVSGWSNPEQGMSVTLRAIFSHRPPMATEGEDEPVTETLDEAWHTTFRAPLSSAYVRALGKALVAILRDPAEEGRLGKEVNAVRIAWMGDVPDVIDAARWAGVRLQRWHDEHVGPFAGEVSQWRERRKAPIVPGGKVSWRERRKVPIVPGGNVFGW